MAGELKKGREGVEKVKKSVGFNWKRESTKDKQRDLLLQKMEEERKEREEEARQQAELKR